MIVISQIDEATKVDSDFVRCPVCKGRLCDKAKGQRRIFFNSPVRRGRLKACLLNAVNAETALWFPAKTMTDK